MAAPSVTIGDIVITALHDRAPTASLQNLAAIFPTVPAAQWAPYRARYPRCFPTGARWSPDMNPLLLRTPAQLILVDTGDGPMPGADPAAGQGQLLAALAAHGVRPEDIDLVYLTHLHPDHSGWNLTAEGAPTFPRARYLVPASEWAWVRQPEVAADYATYGFDATAAVAPLAACGVLEVVPDDAAIAVGVTVVPTPGHTGGHTSLHVASGGHKRCSWPTRCTTPRR